MLAVNAINTSMLQKYIARYSSWRTAQNLYNKQDHVLQNLVHGLPCFHAYNVEQINQCESEIVVIDNIKEGFHQQEYFSQYDKTKKYLIVSGSRWNPSQVGLDFEYDVIWHNYYWYVLLETLANPTSAWFYQRKDYNWDCNKPWQFYSMTAQPRLHRVDLIALLQEKMSNKNWVFRNNNQDYGVCVNGIDFVDLQDPAESAQQFPLRFQAFDQSFLATTCAVDMSVANQCHYHLICESDYGEVGSFTPTEKIFKTLLVGQPFVVVGTKYFLENLRALGFRTYNELWDESYDTMDNRVEAVADLCAELERFDWQAAQPKLQETAKHNQAQLLKLDVYATQEFEQMEQQVLDFYNKWM